MNVTNDDEGEGGGVTIPPKIDDVIYEQPLTASHICNAPNTPTLGTVHVCSTNERRSLNVYFPTLLIKSDGIFLVQTSEGYNYVQVVAPFYSRCILAIWVNYNSGIW